MTDQTAVTDAPAQPNQPAVASASSKFDPRRRACPTTDLAPAPLPVILLASQQEPKPHVRSWTEGRRLRTACRSSPWREPGLGVHAV